MVWTKECCQYTDLLNNLGFDSLGSTLIENYIGLPKEIQYIFFIL